MSKKTSFGFQKPEDSPGLLLWQTTITWQRLIKKALAEYDITHPEFVILAILLWFYEHHQQPTQVMMVELSKLDKMTLSQSLKRLTAKRLVIRKAHAVDTRAKSVGLTSEGKALIKKLVPLVEKIDEDFFGKLNAAKQKSLIQLLQTLN